MSYKEEKYIDIDGQVLTKVYINQEGMGRIEYIDNRGQPHRFDGPARIWADGTLVYFQNGKLHREAGPAYISQTNENNYWLDGIHVSKRDIDLLWLKKQVDK